MSTFLYWFGVLHVAAYATAAFLLASALFIDWTLRKLKIKRDVVIAFNEYLKRKHAKPKGDKA